MEILSQLRDIHLPDPIAWWYPETIGWYVIFVNTLAISAYLLWRYISKYRPIKKQVRALLSLPRDQRPLYIMMTLKVAAIAYAPKVANRLQGRQWTVWLEQQNIRMNESWKHWLEEGYLDNQPPPKDWHKKLSSWLKKLQ